MTVFHPIFLAILVASVAIVLAAVWSVLVLLRFWKVWNHRRREGPPAPCCAACGFDLRGTWPNCVICPECGTDLLEAPAAIRWEPSGPLRKHMRLACIVLGLITVVCSALLWPRVTSAPWRSWYPTSWLMKTATDPAATGDPTAALNVLADRLEAGNLSPEPLQTLVDHAFSVQGDPETPWLPAWGRIIEGAWRAGSLPDSRISQYVQQALDLTITATPSRVGQWSLLHTAVAAAGPARTSNAVGMGIEVTISDVRIDGQSVHVEQTESANLWVGAPLMTRWITRAEVAAPGEPGTHDLAGTVSVVLYDASISPYRYAPPVTLTTTPASFTVVQREAEAPIYLSDPAVDDMVRQACDTRIIVIDRGLEYEPACVISYSIEHVPCSAWMHVDLRLNDGTTVRIGDFWGRHARELLSLKQPGDPRNGDADWSGVLIKDPDQWGRGGASGLGPSALGEATRGDVIYDSVLLHGIRWQMQKNRVFWCGRVVDKDVPIYHFATPEDAAAAGYPVTSSQDWFMEQGPGDGQ
ncbi:MAG: hypothetical protein D8M59_10155 [Planctomycetes bacterium]|nr:hypothetical protein [Planctomycetota bacterium]NOG55205.1 hypothetical protein [Planctomycetota bacterium]